MANDDYRDQHAENRKHGLAARHETRVERATLRAEWLDAVEQAMRGHDCTEAVNRNIPYLARVAVDVATPYIRQQVAEEIAQAIETFQAESAAAPMAVQLAIGSGHNYLVRAVEIAREIGSKEHSNQATEETK